VPDRKDVLAYTHQGTDTVEQRVYYTLTLNHKGQSLGTEERTRRSCALLSSLVDLLKAKQILSITDGVDDVDQLLLQFGQDEMLRAGG